LPSFAVAILRPHHSHLLRDRTHSIDVFVERDTDNLESMIAALLVGSRYVSNLLHTGAAPSRPKINEYDLSTKIPEANRLTVYGLKVEIQRFSHNLYHTELRFRLSRDSFVTA
jgi:hypothetical protein